jgi:two-component system NarL family response regulator
MTNNLMIVGSSQFWLDSWKRDLGEFVSTTLAIDSLDALGDNFAQTKPKVLMLAYELIGSNDLSSISRISAETRIIVVGSEITEEVEWKLLKVGVRGCCRNDVDSKFLRQVVIAVRDGELWIRRSLTCRLIDELGRATAKNKVYRESLGHLNKLTQREYDIAVRVGNGESNKLIARACGITERTVKAHLTQVFQKLDVTDRLNLALVLSADDRTIPRRDLKAPILGALEISHSAIPSHSSL